MMIINNYVECSTLIIDWDAFVDEYYSRNHVYWWRSFDDCFAYIARQFVKEY